MIGKESPDDSQQERATRLREEIERITKNDPDKPESASGKSPEKLSPRDFINKRMQELDKKD